MLSHEDASDVIQQSLICYLEHKMNTLQHFWNDESGVVVSAELILVVTILVIGMVVGLTSLRDQVIQELGDVALAIASVNQSFSFSGATGHHSSTAGSIFVDFLDDCDGPDTAGAEPACIEVCDIPATTEDT
jgi:Flp pilus assembly pilin Flp